MRYAPRFSLILVAILAITSLTACETHDRRIYTTRKEKNLHVPDPFAPSTTKAADEATAPLGVPPETPVAPDATGPLPSAEPAPGQ